MMIETQQLVTINGLHRLELTVPKKQEKGEKEDLLLLFLYSPFSCDLLDTIAA